MSKEVIIKFKEKFKEHIICRRSEEKLEKEKDMWNKAFQFQQLTLFTKVTKREVWKKVI